MKSSLWLTLAVLASLLAVGCEDDGRKNPNNLSYSDQTYISIEVRNFYAGAVQVWVENSPGIILESGESYRLPFTLIGNEDVWLSIRDPSNGIVFGDKTFDRKYSYYHLNVYGPGDVKKY